MWCGRYVYLSDLEGFPRILSRKFPRFRGAGEVSSLRHRAVPYELRRLPGSIQVGLLLLDSTPSAEGRFTEPTQKAETRG